MLLLELVSCSFLFVVACKLPWRAAAPSAFPAFAFVFLPVFAFARLAFASAAFAFPFACPFAEMKKTMVVVVTVGGGDGDGGRGDVWWKWGGTAPSLHVNIPDRSMVSGLGFQGLGF